MNKQTTIHVRVAPDAEVETRSVLGVNWTKKWLRVEHFDDATIAALHADQYLEVVEGEDDPENTRGGEEETADASAKAKAAALASAADSKARTKK